MIVEPISEPKATATNLEGRIVSTVYLDVHGEPPMQGSKAVADAHRSRQDGRQQ